VKKAAIGKSKQRSELSRHAAGKQARRTSEKKKYNSKEP
jgi:hypothetical protein